MIVILAVYKIFFGSFVVPDTIVLKEGDTFQSFLQPLGSLDRLRVKLADKFGDYDMSHI